MKYPLYIVTGAPGSGKSTTLEAFLELHSSYIAFDIDWLAKAASSLADKDIYSDPSIWKPYGLLWFEVLHAVYRNGQTQYSSPQMIPRILNSMVNLPGAVT